MSLSVGSSSFLPLAHWSCKVRIIIHHMIQQKAFDDELDLIHSHENSRLVLVGVLCLHCLAICVYVNIVRIGLTDGLVKDQQKCHHCSFQNSAMSAVGTTKSV